MKKVLIVLAVILGIGCLVVAYVYWTTPANALPSFFPGYDATLAGVHTKHGIAAFVVGLALLIYAWFASGKKNSGGSLPKNQ